MATAKKSALPAPWRWLLLSPLLGLWLLAAHLGWLESIENQTIDWRFRCRGERSGEVPIVYVDIDSTALEVIGNWPWSRAFFERTCRALIETGHVDAIGIDVVMSDVAQAQLADRHQLVAGNIEFARFLREDPPVVLAAAYAAESYHDERGIRHARQLPRVQGDSRAEEDWEEPEKPRFDVGRQVLWSPACIGLIDTLHDDTRVVPLWAPTNVRPYYHLAVELTRLHFRLPPSGVQVSAEHLDFVGADGAVRRRVPLAQGQLLEINWRTAWRSPFVTHYSFATVYAQAEGLRSGKPEEQLAARAFFAQPLWRNAIVLVGPVDRLLQDLGPSPFDAVPIPKVSVHGNLVQSMVAGDFLHRLSAGWNVGIICLLTICVSWLAVAGSTRTFLRKLGAISLLVCYAGAGLLIFIHANVILPLVAPLGAAFTTSFVALIWQAAVEEKQKGRLKSMFGTYVSPELVNRMIASQEMPRLGGVEAEITAFFSDIQGFSTFSEKMTPPQLVELMNEYLSACTEIVQAEGGTLDKYIGDAVVAMYGAPVALHDHAGRACVAAVRIQQRVAALRSYWRDEAPRWPEAVAYLRTRIGLNSGVATVGNMGSSTRFNYTMMGDAVNLAARMESSGKYWGVYTLCTEATRVGCEQAFPGRIVFRPLGRVVVKGRVQPEPIYELVGFQSEVSDSSQACLSLFRQGLTCYLAREWGPAGEFFQKSAQLEPNQPGRDHGIATNPSLFFQARVEECLRCTPSAGWTGTHVIKDSAAG